MTKYLNNTVTSLSLTLGNVSISNICKLVSSTNMVNMLNIILSCSLWEVF